MDEYSKDSNIKSAAVMEDDLPAINLGTRIEMQRYNKRVIELLVNCLLF